MANSTVGEVFQTMPAPRPVVAHLVYFDPEGDKPGFWTLRVYRDDFEKNSTQDKIVISNWISDVVRTVRMVEPNFWLEVHERTPR